ncbi:MAG: SAM-dependent methyltransferase [Halobacteriota archaeon]
MATPDVWAKRARAAGYRSRASFKLRQLDDSFDLFDGVEAVVDLGAAPGGWLQVAIERTNPDTPVVGVDRRSIPPLDHDQGNRLHLIQGDITEEATRRELERAVEGSVGLVLSDMAPDMSGTYDLDHARSVHLGRQAFAVARSLLAPGGDLVIKVFEGRDLAAFRAELDDAFEYVATARPEATRDASSEVYLVAKGFLTAPVRPGERHRVTIEAIGDEGDGIARIEGFTLFVPDTDVDDQVEIEVTDVKPRFGFARRLS